MGDVIHALPAVASLKHSFPAAEVTWIVDPRWAPLLADNPFVDNLVLFDRRHPGSWRAARATLRSRAYAIAVDFQGLIKSALTASLARPERIVGFHQSQVRERPAALFYSNRVLSESVHVVDRNLDLAVAAGATNLLKTFAIPTGVAEGNLPEGDFVLASPLAGWKSKQWPLEHYAGLARRLRNDCGTVLLLNGPPEARDLLATVPGVRVNTGGLAGLIHATRCASAVIGVDSGPMHLAAALGKPGVAIFGPTDPARNGPYGGSLTVLRRAAATTTYKRHSTMDENMMAITPEMVMTTLRAVTVCQ